MGIKIFQIEIQNNPNLSYFPGQTVQGILHLKTDKPCVSEGIQIKFEGRAEVCWAKERVQRELTGFRYNQREGTWRMALCHSAKEQYFDSTIQLSSDPVIPEGDHEYPFHFTLPHDLPSSFLSLTGRVTYQMESLMKRPKKSDCKARVPFTINGIYDLNRNPQASQEIQVEKYKNSCCLCCKSGPVGFLLKIPRRGFVCGEFLPFTVELTNQSRRRVKGATVYLIQIITCHSPQDSERETFEEIICKVKGPSVGSRETEIWTGNILKIPPLPPSKLKNCRIIDIDYIFRIDMEVGGLALNLIEEVPIIIGSIPLQNTFQSLLELQAIQSTHGGQLRLGFTGQTSILQDSYPDLPPPTYAESVENTFTIEGHNNEGLTSDDDPPPYENGFSPKYLTYL